MSSRPHVRHCLDVLRADVGDLFVENAEEWGRRVDAYHGKLRRTETNVLESACEVAATRYPGKFPTAGQLLSLCIAVEQRLKAEGQADEAETRKNEDDANNQAYVNELREFVIPDTPAGQDKWIADGDSLAERTARQWEVDSMRRNFDPNRPSPRDVAAARFRELEIILTQPPPSAA